MQERATTVMFGTVPASGVAMRTCVPCSACHAAQDPDARECALCGQPLLSVTVERQPAQPQMTIQLRPTAKLIVRSEKK